MKNIKILILGADGFIGSNMIYSLVREEKYSIRAFDFFKNGISKNLEPLRGKIEFFRGNFMNKSNVEKALKGVDYVFHYLSSTTPGSSMDNPLMDINTNIYGMLSFLEECARAKIKMIVYSSSGGTVYGDQGKKKYSEKDNTNPISPYGISKLAIEKYLEYYRINHGIDYIILRYANLYGPGQNISGSQGIIPIFINLIRQKKPVSIFGDGKNMRDYLYISDAVDITKKIFLEKKSNSIYNIGSGKGITINNIVKIIEKVTKIKADIKKLPKRNVDLKSVVLNTNRIKKEFGFSPKVSIEEGIKKTWNWINLSR